MQVELIRTRQSSVLLLLFAGWGMDSAVMRGADIGDCDVAVVYDYRDITDTAALDALIRRYECVNVVAWSFGVYVASRVLGSSADRLGRRIAVNGTTTPIDDKRGIAPAIFAGTLAGMNERNLRKFYRRMCVSAAEFADFVANNMSARKVDELIYELAAFGREVEGHPQADFLWDYAVIGRNDAIFTAEAQRRAWGDTTAVVVETESGHWPDFSTVISRLLLDKSLVAKGFNKAKTTYHDHADMQRSVAARLWQYASSEIALPLNNVIEVGSGTGVLTSLYAPWLAADAHLELWDLVEYDMAHVPEGARFVCCDAEQAIASVAPESCDLIVSASTMQWFQSPARFIEHSLAALRPGGILALSTFAPDNLSSLSSLTGSGLVLPGLDVLSRMVVNAGGAMVVAEEEDITLNFDSVQLMLRHLSDTGVNGIRNTDPQGAVRRVIARYPRRPDGSCSLNYKPIYLIIRK